MQLNIRVGASIDRSLSVAYQPLVAAAKKARAAIEGQGRTTGASVARETKKGVDAADREFAKLAKQSEKWHRQMVRDAERASREQLRAKQREEREAGRLVAREAKEHEAAERQKTRATEREAAARNRQVEREMRAAARAVRERGGRADRAARFGGRVALGAGRAALGIMGDLARGAGVDLDLGSVFAKNASLESLASELSNQGFMAGDARNGQRVDTRELTQQALDVAQTAGGSANAVLEGLGKFTAKTGDLATGREILERMAVQAKATGSSLDDMLDAAGDISNALKDVENKGEKIDQLMLAFSGQGKLGAVEIKNLATQMAKLGAAAGSFEGGSRSIVQMGVLAQMSRAQGGASSATQAASSVAAFASAFSKGSTLAHFKEFGVNVHGEGGKLRLPKEILIDALRSASSSQHGGLQNFSANMGEMFRTAQSRRAVKGFENVFLEKGGGEAGIAAVEREFKRLETAAMSNAEVMESFKRAMSTSTSQAEVFNAQMQKAAGEMQNALTPAMQQLAPKIVALTTASAKFVTWFMGGRANGGGVQVRGGTATDVAAAVKTTEAQIAGGQISKATLAENAHQETAAFARREAAKYDVKNPQHALTATERVLLQAGDYDPGKAVFNAISGYFGLDMTGKAAVKEDDERAEQRKKAAEDAKVAWQKIHDENAKTNRLLERGLVVKVEAPPSPPDVPGHGTAPQMPPTPPR